IFLDVVRLFTPRQQHLLAAMTLLTLGSACGCRNGLRMSGPAPLFDKRMMRAVVTLTAAVRQSGINTQRRQRLCRIRVLHVRQTRTVTRLALYVVIAGILYGFPTAWCC